MKLKLGGNVRGALRGGGGKGSTKGQTPYGLWQ